MKLSIHLHITGKVARKDITKFDLSKFHNIEQTWDEVFALITVEGVATSAEVKDNRRKESNFISRELIMVDIDENMTLEELHVDEFFLKYSAGFYTTPSHAADHHKFRIMFRLATPITDVAKLRKVTQGLLVVYKQADVACKDATRLFYGCVNATHCLKTELLLPDEVVDDLVELSDVVVSEVEAQPHKVYAPASTLEKEAVISLLSERFIGVYETWRNIGWGLRAGGYECSDFVRVTACAMREKSENDAAKIWNSYQSNGIGMGTVFNFLKKQYGEDIVKMIKASCAENINYLGGKYKADYARLRELRLKQSKAKLNILRRNAKDAK